MLSYCLRCWKNTENINLRVSNTSNGKTMLLPVSKVPLLGDILF